MNLSTKDKDESLPQTPGLSLPLQQAQNISFPHGPLDISDNTTSSSSSSVSIHEFNTDLSNISGVSSAAEDPVHFSEFYWLIHGYCFIRENQR
mmetsp:Transcript_31214/g.64304  ORF Transcript_31214/g.64304 Transcript_31214/m.64304 type:complete len:93 (+) Transcript_31214:41-319(+)